MALHLMNCLRFIVISVTALGLTACARMNLPDQARLGIEPRFGEPPARGQAEFRAAPGPAEAGQVEALSLRLDELAEEIGNLRNALAVMGPLPEQTPFLAPADLSDAGFTTETEADLAKAKKLADLYAPPPPLGTGKSLFFEAEMGSYASRGLAEAKWDRVAIVTRIAGLQPHFIEAGGAVRLSVGPLASEAAVNALCVELSAVIGACRPLPPMRAY
jgi:SPOR domain